MMVYLSGAAPPPPAPALGATPSGTGVSAWLTGLVAVLWAYDGAAGLCSLGGELRSPQRNLPRALIIGVGSVILVYVAINLGLLQSLAPATIAASPLPLAVAIEPALGVSTASWVACLVIVSTAGTLAVSVLADPRVFMAMARDGNFFGGVGAVSNARHTPVNAIVLHSALACVYVCVRSFEQLAATYVLGLVPFYVLVAIAAWRLRRSRATGSLAFRAPALSLLCGVWIVAAFLLIGNALAETPSIVAINLGLTGAGVPAYFLWRLLRVRRVQYPK
jgi:APA family basic amino acid/polyamine antiporter